MGSIPIRFRFSFAHAIGARTQRQWFSHSAPTVLVLSETVLVLCETVLVLCETVLVLSETVLVLDSLDPMALWV